MDDRIWLLIDRHLSGDATPRQEAELERWLAGDPSRAALLDRMRTLMEVAGRPAVRRDVERAWRALHAEMLQPRATPRQPDAARMQIRPGGRRVPSGVALWVAAAVAAVALGGAVLWSRFASAPEPQRAEAPALTFATARGQRETLRLREGTIVTVAPESRLRIAGAFGDSVREVWLDGDAYFEVTHDARRPFIVHAGEALTRVLGTRFVVRAYGGDRHVVVAVAQGRVSVRSEAATRAAPIVLAQGQVGRVSAGERARILPGADARTYLSWTEGRLVFQDERLPDVLREVGRWYNAELTADRALRGRHLTLSLDSESLHMAVDLIALSLGAEYEWHGNVIRFSPKATTR